MGILLSEYLYQPNKDYIGYWCPGCEDLHVLRLQNESGIRPAWTFNGNVEKPTFQPSVDYKVGHHVPGHAVPPDCEECHDAELDGRETLCTHCHSWVIDGTISYLGDTTHKLKSLVVPIPKLPDHVLGRMKFG